VRDGGRNTQADAIGGVCGIPHVPKRDGAWETQYASAEARPNYLDPRVVMRVSFLLWGEPGRGLDFGVRVFFAGVGLSLAPATLAAGLGFQFVEMAEPARFGRGAGEEGEV